MAFDESAWSLIEEILPGDEEIKRFFGEDFMWFMKRPHKYKSDIDKVENYIRHLQFKSNPRTDIIVGL